MYNCTNYVQQSIGVKFAFKVIIINTCTPYNSLGDKHTLRISVVSTGVGNKVGTQFAQIYNFQSKNIYPLDKFPD